MKKRNYWPLFFIAIFAFTVYMIIWTIYKATQAPVIEDRSFMQKYQYVDENYNSIMTSNINFLEKYSLELDLNGKIFPLTTEDIKYGQRVIEKYSNHKDILKVGDNSLNIVVLNKTTNEKMPISIDLLITKTMSDDSNLNLKDENFINEKNLYTTNFNLSEETNWIITGSFKIENEIGYIFIKTNAK
ncbi:hypothetical protein CRU87_01070 [Aliarcobacter trophiarum LMG 25534]|uniref:Cytochrome c oxidase-associated protein CcoH n=1 Tax=Aliarcobacter trophiarum LMG 25534 TaxID=1032241 RepID=A0AAD0VLI6_9BACT|nr:hypothetical protein [Aliarcobacter trophiarum]AXK48214.1 putative cytochrome c oxidase-associated protein CcoH [Aliarcobacter trophiarum LMG 25534]RXJ93111.1 hypothetical protein CRU87_01070 [Aliarcobacter trophiarum LMG 25534]